MLLQDVEETYIDDSTKGAKLTRNIEALYMRGDTIITVSPLNKQNNTAKWMRGY